MTALKPVSSNSSPFVQQLTAPAVSAPNGTSVTATEAAPVVPASLTQVVAKPISASVLPPAPTKPCMHPQLDAVCGSLSRLFEGNVPKGLEEVREEVLGAFEANRLDNIGQAAVAEKLKAAGEHLTRVFRDGNATELRALLENADAQLKKLTDEQHAEIPSLVRTAADHSTFEPLAKWWVGNEDFAAKTELLKVFRAARKDLGNLSKLCLALEKDIASEGKAQAAAHGGELLCLECCLVGTAVGVAASTPSYGYGYGGGYGYGYGPSYYSRPMYIGPSYGYGYGGGFHGGYHHHHC